ncbi:uncharacterized protein LOC133526977 [Cydia pomonella]|uniref:uncharacterized protein LOC133526977 n=1 Tax=Cydia pomonella TaxID=82600 RepID=UPI002ADE377D|nr:uncharacterized protein LOC133526977 [Cydia pomonella]XP_061719838.1 uncharacterized protein LOC133526977 [Cydia pomonella]
MESQQIEDIEDVCDNTDNIKDTQPEMANLTEDLMAHQDLIDQRELLLDVPEHDLDDSILKVLGNSHEKPQQWGKKIHNQIAERWESVLMNGLDKQEKEDMLKQSTYLPPENCPHLIVPKLNPETAAACSELSRKKDGYIEIRQKMLSASISGLACALEKVINEVEPNDVKLQLLEVINNTVKILADTFYNENKSRRMLILSGLDKEIRDTLIETQPDKYLFGENLYEKIKTAKTMGKTGREIRFQPKAPRTNFPKQPSNWKGPPRQVQRTQEPRAMKHRGSGPRPAPTKRTSASNKGYRKQYSSSHHRHHQR